MAKDKVARGKASQAIGSLSGKRNITDKITLADMAQDAVDAFNGTGTIPPDGSVTPEKTTSNSHFGLLAYNNAPIDFDFVANTITIYNSTVLIFKKTRYTINSGLDRTIDITTMTSGLMYGLYYNVITNVFSIFNTGEISVDGTITNDMVLIANFNKGISNGKVNCASEFTINGKVLLVNGKYPFDNVNYHGYFVGDQTAISFDFYYKKIKVKSGVGSIVHQNTRYSLVNAQEIDISSLAGAYYYLYFDTATNLIGYAQQGVITPPSTAIVFASFAPPTNVVYRLDDCLVNGRLNKVYAKDYFILDCEINGDFTAKTYADGSVDAPLPVMNMSYSYIYELYDALVSAYPEYVTKILLGNESTGLPIYRYDFKPTRPIGVTSKFPKVFLTSGIHPEKTGVWCLYNFMKAICEDWKTNALVDVLRWNVNFIVVPMVNPWSYDNGSRTNVNGVDINRNFSAGWTLGTFGDIHYGGATPLSELEAQYVDSILSNNKDILFHIDFHNYEVDDGYKMCVLSNHLLMTHIGQAVIAKMSRKWKQEQLFLPQNDTTMLGYTGLSVDGGLTAQAISYGIQSATFEVCQQYFDEPNTKINSAIVIHYSVECFANFVLVVLKNLTSRF